MNVGGEQARSVMSSVRERIPRDLALVVGCTLVTDLAVVAPVAILRVPFGALLALFLPGYALFSALFPDHGRRGADGDPSLLYVERVLFSVGASVVTTVVVAAAFNFTPYGIEVRPILASLSGIVLLASAVGAFRRRGESPNRRPSGLSAVASDRFARFTGGDGRLGTAANAVLLASLLLAVGSAAYAVTGPNQGTSHTEFYLLTENESGELVAGDYPEQFVRGQNRSLYLGIDNQERRELDYTVVVQMQRVRTQNGSTVVVERKQLRRMHVQVGPNETKTVRHRVGPTMVGDQLRLTYLLYRDGAPSNPTVENAYREVHLLVDVSANATASV